MNTLDVPPTALAGSRRALSRVGLLLTTLVLILAVRATQPTQTQAGTYDVYSCEQPNYAAAPIDGWTPTTNNANAETVNECGEGGFMWAAVLGDRATPVGAEAVWAFVPPPGAAIREATLYRFFNDNDNEDTGNAFTYENLDAPYRLSSPFAKCGDSAVYHYECSATGPFMGRTAPNTEVKVPSADLVAEHGGPNAGIYIIAGCGGFGGGSEEHCNGGTEGPIGYAGLSGATITLEDNTPPKVAAIGGTLVTGTELEGEQNLAITGTDTGSGIYQAILEVDGEETQATTVDNNGGHCENVGQTTDGRLAFLYTVPCALEVNDQYVFFNMAGISDGSHRLTVLVTDAAGNATTVLNREVIVGRGACNGTCEDQAKLTASNAKLLKSITRGYARSGLRLSGALREPTDSPVTDARLELLQQPSYTGAPLRAIASTTTNAAGEWTFVVPRGPSRVLLVAWRSHALDTGYAAQLEYHENVFADVELFAPRRVGAGVPFDFRGELIGGYTPPEHSLIQMEIFFLGRWRTIETLRTNARGRFSYRYTFSPEVADRTSYLFRAVIQYSRVYPFLAATSWPVRVRVG
jgi:hypothetical protein